MAVWRILIACRIPKAASAHTEYVILVAIPWLNERASVFRCTYIACLCYLYYGISRWWSGFPDDPDHPFPHSLDD